MARKQLPPRLELRGSVYRIIDGDKRISTLVETRQEAERCLELYVAGKASPVPESRTISALLDAYSSSKLRINQQKAGARVAEIARNNGFALEEIDRREQLARNGVKCLSGVDYQVQHLRNHLGKLPVNMINSGVINKYMEDRRAERRHLAKEAKAAGKTITGKGILSDTTIARDLVILKAALSWAEKEAPKDWFDNSGRPRFSMPVSTTGNTSRRACTKAEAQALVSNAPMPHLKLFLRIGFATGARKEAIEELRWDMIDFDGNTINFGNVDHKKRRPKISMIPELREHLLAAYKFRCSDYVIEYKGSKAGNVKKGIASAARRACLPWFTPHIMKHSFVTWMAEDGHQIHLIADLVNTTPQTLKQHYCHLFHKLDNATVSTLSLGV